MHGVLQVKVLVNRHSTSCIHNEQSSLPPSYVQMLMDLGPQVYQDDFERHFLERAAEFYQVLFLLALIV